MGTSNFCVLCERYIKSEIKNYTCVLGNKVIMENYNCKIHEIPYTQYLELKEYLKRECKCK